ncbi:uncharacterized protein LOC106132978 [Amyelois transitella]|uniref:uncharacterized protein LOC106132978 n=1 Tax=Amyelois transitella TaxID=680683 RepID=UPI00299053A7|nr:uncharacterized protein LOC106132978 [Amyelois transitella]
MEALLLKQDDIYERLFKAYSTYRKSPKERISVSYIESKMENLEKLFSNFDNIHFQIVSNVNKEKREQLEYFNKDMYGRFEETYTDYKTRMKDDLRKFNTSGPGKSCSEKMEVKCEAKLPQIQLPKFSGSYEEWQAFYDMFQSLIHQNSNLSAVQKLHYLKSSLSGEPENLLKNLSTTDINYEEAWKQLTRRYNNKRFNCNEILKRLFSQRNLSIESASSIKQLLDTTSACLKSLQNMSINIDSWDPMINHLVVSKLDIESRKLWELQISQTESEDLPNWSQLVKFLEMRFRTLEMIDTGGKQKPAFNSPTNKVAPKQKSFHATVQEEKKKIACVMCPNHHLLYVCPQFLSQSPQERSEFVQSKRLCFNCFSSNHSVKNCRQPTSCRRCGRRHHTLLHFDRSQLPESSPATTSAENPVPAEPSASGIQTETRVTSHFVQGRDSEVLLATARVKAVTCNGLSKVLRALIDQGSEASFVTEATVQSLGLKKKPVNGLISGVGEGETRTKGMVSLELESLHNPEFSIKVDAFVLSSLTSFLPTNKTYIKDWPEFESLSLADPYYGSPEKIDLLLGVEVHSEIIVNGLLKHPHKRGPIAQNTQFGWVLTGRVSSGISSSKRLISLHIRVKEDELLQKFWEIEREPDSLVKKMSREEIKCEEIYESSTERNENGRYKVRLPFRDPDPDCFYGQSKNIALRRLNFLEKKLSRNPSLYEEYRNVLQDYIDQNHMEEITDVEEINNERVVYLPHHAVVRLDKETSKVRVVFDASCKGTNNVSLNDCLLVGPKLQQDLRHILMRWRRHPFCLVADLVQMYRQILVHEKDTDCQRILWRSEPNQPLKHYRMLRLTFGTACAPYLAVKSLHQLAKDEYDRNPLAASITLTDFYMDDLLSGSETESDIIKIYEQMNKLMGAGGFCLRKWCSNSERLLNHISEHRGSEQHLILKSDSAVKILGICWNKNTDNFEYTYLLPDDGESQENVTKRKVLSEIARLYDPLGWISPVIVKAKIFIQKLWKCRLEWDQVLTSELLLEWNSYRKDLLNVKDIVIPRWLNTRREDHVELHVFVDASQAAYAAVVFLRTKDKSNNIHVNIVTAKTKVAPVEKEISIPRMELCAAVLGAKLVYEVSQILQIPKEQIFAWSDSMVVLAWLRGDPSRWTTFVSNRVSEILTILDFSQWNHVRTDFNPADCGSRGMPCSEASKVEAYSKNGNGLLEAMV